jgi:hypothetical protein
MTKSKYISSQLTIYDWIKSQAEKSGPRSNPSPGSLAIIKELKAAMSDDLRYASDELDKPLSRYQVAARMSDLLGEEITKTTLDNWTAMSHPHEIPASHIPAFILATGGQRRTAEVISKHSGLFLLPGPEALRAEIQRHDEIIQKNKTEKLKKMIFLKEIEK